MTVSPPAAAAAAASSRPACPRMSVKNCQPGVVSIAEPIPRKPPPAWKYSSNACFCVASSRSDGAGVEEDHRAELLRAASP